ncbi:hypothetical protein ANCDUO_23100 [Ancylostoma duodenale]|uniref:Phosphoenolpyruvate carboxykinase C-terminal P-loop domain-containing protein n=1 Tax=Ancylostoma duodenale TaxID=51022 RepID=A0A0C2FJA1_9BILA|nr:hypothetical protein ANCDUO_23100 [Ancylostoma duodenale]
MTPTLPGWQVRMLGDDVAWIRCGTDGRMHALAPENGLFGCTVRCTPENGGNLLKMISNNAILVNCASTNKGRFHWEGLENLLSKEERVSDWRRENWSSDQNRRTDEMPLIYETESWEHGVIMAAGIRTISYSALDMPCSALVNDPLCMRTSMSFSFPHLIKQWLDIKQNVREVC